MDLKWGTQQIYQYIVFADCQNWKELKWLSVVIVEHGIILTYVCQYLQIPNNHIQSGLVWDVKVGLIISAVSLSMIVNDLD